MSTIAARNQLSYLRAEADRLAFIHQRCEHGASFGSIRMRLVLRNDLKRSSEQTDRIARSRLQDVCTRAESLSVIKSEFECVLRCRPVRSRSAA